MLLTELVLTSQAVAATPRRSVKIDKIAGLLREAGPAEVPVVVAFLSGELRQRQIGVGYAALGGLLTGDGAAGGTAPTLTVSEVDAVFAEVGAVTGPGAQAARKRLLAGLFGRATAGERDFLIRLIAGELHQGALEGVMTEAVARAAGVPASEVRRAHLLGGSLQAVAAAALGAPAPAPVPASPGAAPATIPAPAISAASAALRSFGLQVGRPLRPMLASSASSIAAAFARVSPAAVEWKIDGIRIQVHRDDAGVAVFTRTLDNITARVPEIAEAALALDVRQAVLDGEAVALRPGGRPRPFQVTAGRTGSHTDVGRQRADVPLTAFFFDLLHLDGTDLIDEPASDRHALLTRVVPADLLIPRVVTADVAAAEAFLADAVARGHEGVVVKSLPGLYAAGRRGSEWIKVKPRHTLDLVVLAAEWGHGRRRGWLSNLHLGARDPASGGLVMLGKTFKGLTDEMLTWQTARLLELAEEPARRPAGDPRDAYGVLRVRPELVVEVAFDGVQASPRYPGGLALRFARVLRHRPDKPASEADTIDAVRALWADEPAEPGQG
ncbi:MAG TPA: ATP-dependent DNA ligase [Streptosporangiaceae bacterium]|nr:ATP-dependent DNA ligase [Streptosporangiaceae bacterium]